MKAQITTLLQALLFSICPCLSSAQTQPVCPTPPTLVVPMVKSEISFNPKNNLYTFSYTVENVRSSPLGIDSFIIKSEEAPHNQTGSKHWLSDFVNLPETPRHILWSTASNEIKPGQSLGGFSFQSARAPGPVKYYVRGNAAVPTTIPVGKDDEPTPNCPGFFFDTKPLEGDVVGVTTGPMPPGQVAAYIRIHRTEFATENKALYLEAHDPGMIHVTLLGSDKFDVTKVDASTIVFGPAGAKPISIKTIETETEKDSDHGKGKEKTKEKHKSLLLKFAVKDLGLRCNIDHALFITGRISGNPFFGGGEVKPEVCKAAPAPSPKPLKKKGKEEDAD